ncbi:MAG TPA: aminoglycoside 6-adenylyltransferase [Candidatus Limnocylindrales bacterium]|nr:aminoglycoside 6-adenylyltransferase [Candidatus Limnocylindrales bacterium]
MASRASSSRWCGIGADGAGLRKRQSDMNERLPRPAPMTGSSLTPGLADRGSAESVTAQDAARAYEEIADRFVRWATAEDAIRAAVVIGSRARTDHPADEWADLDILIWSTDPARYLRSADWTAEIAEPWLSFVETSSDSRVQERRVLFAGGLDVDFAFVNAEPAPVPSESLADLAAIIFGRGVRVLLDRDGVVAGLMAAVPPRVPPAAPEAAAFDQVTSDFWYHAVWTAKHLRRGELWWAKGACDVHLKGLLRVVLEWDAAARGRDPWFRGRFLEQWADQDTVYGLRSAFAHYDEDEIWAALEVTLDLFSRVAQQVATALSLPYSEPAEQRARELVRAYAANRGEGRQGQPARRS